jgi:hypothetical protein
MRLHDRDDLGRNLFLPTELICPVTVPLFYHKFV